jgi:flavin-dependent dehydrogenase
VQQYDSVIIGGGLTGAAAGLLLLRARPHARVLILEAAEAFPPVSVATSEIGGLFLTSTLRLWDHLAREELPSHGPRFWFHNEEVLRIQQATELGTWGLPSVPSFLLREDVLNEHLLERAVNAGCELSRPARVTDIMVRPWDSRVRWQEPDGEHEVRTPWVLDASGRSCVLGTALGLVRPNLAHPITSITGHWTGDLDLDGPAFDPDTEFGQGPAAARRLCTNHFQGYGYRVLVQPTGGRTVDAERGLRVSVVYDRRVIDLDPTRDVGDAYTRFLSGLPATRQLLSQASLPRQSLEVLPQVAYDLDQVAGLGWALLGSAAGYVDPCGSPGADNVARTVGAALRFVIDHLDGKPVEQAVSRYDAAFVRSWKRAFEGRYRDRYLLCGDFDLYWPALLMDRALYMLCEVAPRARAPSRAIGRLPMEGLVGTARAALMRTYTARLRTLARRRMWTGHYGRHNAGRRLNYRTDLGAGSLWTLLRGLAGWALREFEDVGLSAAYRLDRWRGIKTLPEGADLTTLPEGIETVGSPPG